MVLSMNRGLVHKSFPTLACSTNHLALPPTQTDLASTLESAKISAPIPQVMQWRLDNGVTYQLLITYSGEIPTCVLTNISGKSLTQIWRVITEDAEQLQKMILKHNSPARATDAIRTEAPYIISSGPQPMVQGCFLNRYLITGLVGKGGMGIVYRATDQRLGRTVALKMLRADRLEEDKLKQRFEKEMRICTTLKHPNIVSVFDYGYSIDNTPYMVMEYVGGKTLSDLQNEIGALSIPIFVNVFSQLCSALTEAHKLHCIHRDLKPENIMLIPKQDGNYFVKLLDFGIAKVVGRCEKKVQKLTKTGDAIGSPFYMSPEQCRGTDLDARSDIYSLGCVMYESISGRPPFYGSDAIAILADHVNKPVEPLSMVIKKFAIPAKLEYIVLKAIEKNSDDRYQTVDELAADLNQFISEAYSNKPIRLNEVNVSQASFDTETTIAPVEGPAESYATNTNEKSNKPDLTVKLLTRSGIITAAEALASMTQNEGKSAIEYLLELGIISEMIYKSALRCVDLITDRFLSREDAASMLLYCHEARISFDDALAQFE